MGIEAVAKQAESKVIISGLAALGIEITKNIVLAGCKELLLYDPTIVEGHNWEGNFFLGFEDTKKNKSRAELVKDKIQQLYYYVKVTVITDE